MASKDPVDRIIALLGDPEDEKRTAAIVVLGELEIKSTACVEALVRRLDDESPRVRLLAVQTLGRLGARKALPRLAQLLGERDASLREAAIATITSFGESVVGELEKRAAEAGTDERRALDAILAQVGGKAAFGALLASLENASEEVARSATRELRQQIKDASRPERTQYLKQAESFIKKLSKLSPLPAVPLAATLRILGQIEDPRATATLLEFAGNREAPPSARQEAVIGLRFAVTAKQDLGRVVEVLADAALAPDRQLAQTALMTLGGIELPAERAPLLEKIARHRDLERARFALEQLARQIDPHTAKVLAHVIGDADEGRASLVASLLEKRPDAVPELVKILLAIDDTDRMWMIRGVLRHHLEKLTPAQRQKLLDAAIARLREGAGGWKAALDLVRTVDADKTGQALRDLAKALRKAKKLDLAQQVLRALCHDNCASDEDRLALAVLELGHSKLDTHPTARQDDEALRLFNQLALRDFDLGSALRKDKSVGLEQLYYLGFHFVEQDSPWGEELLAQVVKQAGRKKLGTMAKNKLKLARARA
ncbi:MAG: HEAT repeat domain-containing protein [Pseudomonadota bacterium]